MIQRHERALSPVSSSRTVEQLQRLGIVEAVPGQESLFEMTRPVASLLSFLLRQHRLASVEIIRAYLCDIERLSLELQDTIDENRHNMTVRVLVELSDVIERVRQDSRSTRDGIIGQVMRIKANREKYAVRQRFEVINRLWKRYLEPLRDLIDVKKAIDASLDRLHAMVVQGTRAFLHDRAMSREFTAVSYRLLRLRRDMLSD